MDLLCKIYTCNLVGWDFESRLWVSQAIAVQQSLVTHYGETLRFSFLEGMDSSMERLRKLMHIWIVICKLMPFEIQNVGNL